MLDSYVDIIDDNVGLEDNKSQFVYFFLFILQLSIHILILFIKSIIPVIVSLFFKQVKTCLIFPIYNLNGRLIVDFYYRELTFLEYINRETHTYAKRYPIACN